MFTKTLASASPDYERDSIILNEEEPKESQRFRNCLSEVRKLAQKSQNKNTVERSAWKVHIVSSNSFPTKAGLASSASGYACLGTFKLINYSNDTCIKLTGIYRQIYFLVYTLAQLYELDASGSDLSALARRGSGSACRSLFGGFVRWYMEDPCIARPIACANHWPDLRCMVAVVSTGTKSVGSTEGMRRSVQTSTLLQHRIDKVLPNRIEGMQQAILERNFERFAELSMKDSNQFHAVCLDTYPPLFYLNGTSNAIIQLVHLYNQVHQKIKVKTMIRIFVIYF